MPARRSLIAARSWRGGLGRAAAGPGRGAPRRRASTQRYDDHRHARRRRRPPRRGGGDRAHEPLVAGDRPRQPVGRPARARLPRPWPSRSRSTARRSRPSGRPRSTCASRSTVWRRRDRRASAFPSASTSAASPDAFSARTQPRERRPQLRAMVPDRLDRARGLRPGRPADLVHGRCHPPGADDDDARCRATRSPARAWCSAPESRGTAWSCESTDVRDFSFVVNPRVPPDRARSLDGTTLRVYTETVVGRGDRRSGARRRSSASSEAFGDYPWPDLVLAEVGSGGGFSMEYPRMIHLTRDKVADTLRRLPRGRAPVVLRPARQRPAARAVAGRGLRRLQRPLADGHRREPVLDAGRRTARSSPGRPGRPPVATGRAATATSTPSSTRAPSS